MSLYVKFGSLLTKTISKPIANAIKSSATEHESFRRLCIKFAQQVHKADVNVRRRLLGQNDLKVRPLNDKKAIQTGANFLADSFVFAIGGGVILYEYQRSKRKEAQRQATVSDDIKVLQDEVDWLVYQLKLKTILDKDYVVPDDVETTILHLKKRDGSDSATRKGEDGEAANNPEQKKQEGSLEQPATPLPSPTASNLGIWATVQDLFSTSAGTTTGITAGTSTPSK